MRRWRVWLLAAVLAALAVICHVYYSHEADQCAIHVGMTEPEVRAALGRRYAENLSLGDDFRIKRCCHEMYVGDMDWLGHRTTVAVYYDAAGKVASCESGELRRERVSWRLSFYKLTGY